MERRGCRGAVVWEDSWVGVTWLTPDQRREARGMEVELYRTDAPAGQPTGPAASRPRRTSAVPPYTARTVSKRLEQSAQRLSPYMSHSLQHRRPQRGRQGLEPGDGLLLSWPEDEARRACHAAAHSSAASNMTHESAVLAFVSPPLVCRLPSPIQLLTAVYLYFVCYMRPALTPSASPHQLVTHDRQRTGQASSTVRSRPPSPRPLPPPLTPAPWG